MSAHELAPPSLRRPRVTAPRLLVVEDDPSVRGLLRTLLAAEGYQVTVAADGLAALDQASAQRPELILLDVVLPDLGGVRVVEELRADPALAGIPVLVVTGRTEWLPSLRDRLGERNVFGKPFGVEELLARIAEVTGGPTDLAIRLP